MPLSKSQKELLNYYITYSNTSDFRTKKITVRSCTVTVVKVEETNDYDYFIYVKGHPIDKSFYFRARRETWSVYCAPSGGRGHIPDTTYPWHPTNSIVPDVAVKYLNMFFQYFNIDHEKTALKPPLNTATMDCGEDDYDMQSYACVSNGSEEPGCYYFASRTLFMNTSFCKDHDVSVFLNIPDKQEDGICRDSDIKSYPRPAWGADKVCNDLRGLCRYLYPSLQKFKWSSTKELRSKNLLGILRELGSDTKRLCSMNIAVGCCNGRTRSPTVCMFMELQLYVASCLFRCVSQVKEVRLKAVAELEALEQDTSTTRLTSTRKNMDEALLRREGPGGNKKMRADRYDRCV